MLGLKNRVQLPGESVIKYRTEVEWLTVEMSEQKLCSYILMGLNPTLMQIAMLYNISYK